MNGDVRVLLWSRQRQPTHTYIYTTALEEPAKRAAMPLITIVPVFDL